jgi:hypothetical protein
MSDQGRNGRDGLWHFGKGRRRIASMSEPEMTDESPLMCHRCGAELEPGKGDFYVVKIEAFADPTPPDFSEEDLYRDAKAEIGRLIEQMEGLTEQEAMDQVYRRVFLHLCGRCYRQWIEDPTG